MIQIRFDDLAALGQRVGEEFSPYGEQLLITQEMIDRFADLTGDHQWIHVDVERARRESPFKTTIAHGFFTLSLILKLQEGLVPIPENFTHGFNYGLEQVRFISPVPSTSRVRGRFTLTDFREKGRNGWLMTVDTVIEIEGQDRPAVTCKWLSIAYV